jgi:hypothetical protein
LDRVHITSNTEKLKGHNGSKKSLVENGSDANDRKTNGACRAAETSTTWARKTKSGTLPCFSAYTFASIKSELMFPIWDQNDRLI